MTILVVGLGFVGLSAALGFADKGHRVFGYDINAARTKQISNGDIPFYEPDLAEILKLRIKKNFVLMNSIAELPQNVDVVLLGVGTPCDDGGKADLRYLLSAIDDTAPLLNEQCLLVIKSTVPPGTTRQEIIPCARSKGFKGSIAVNPEFLREGSCWKDFTSPDRIVCGIENGDDYAATLLSNLYAPFNAPIYFVTYNTAEFIKYLSNSFLAAMISFSNEMAAVGEALGDINIRRAFEILHEDNRLKNAGINRYIYPGCGYGGYCLPKDTVALSCHAKSHGATTHILDEVISLNQNMTFATASKIECAAANKEAKIGILGLSFKPDSDDVRDSSAAKIIAQLLSDGYENIYAYDPVATENFRSGHNFIINYCDTFEEVCELCSTVAIITAWGMFKGLDKIYPSVKFVDCRYFL